MPGEWPTFQDGFDLPSGRFFVRLGGKGRRVYFLSRISLLVMKRKKNQNPDPLKPKGSATRKG